MNSVQSIFEAVQAACERPIWSRGVQLVRADAVSIEEETPLDISLRVIMKGGLNAPLVTLHPGDEDWECSCASVDDPCEHVAAGVIALRQSQRSGKRLPAQGEGRGRIVYELTERGGELHLARAIEHKGKRKPLTVSLTAIAAGRVVGPQFVATPIDIEIDRHLGSRSHGASASPVLSQVLDRLAGTDRVLLDGQPIRIEAEPLGLLIRVVDAPGGVRLFAEQDRRIERAFRNGVVLGGGALHPLAPNRLNGRERTDLPRGRFYADEELAALVTEILPDLEERVPVRIETRKLPDVKRGERPRLRLELARQAGGLRVLPLLVYGNPPVARIDGGRLIHLGGGSVPIRDVPAEQVETTRLRTELGLRPGVVVQLAPDEAIAFVTRLALSSIEVVGTAHHDFQLRGKLEPSLVIDDDRLELDFGLMETFATEGEAQRGSGQPGSAGRAGAGSSRAQPESVLRAWAEGAQVVALSGGGFGALPTGWLAQYGDRVADLLGARDAKGRVARHALPDLASLCDDLDQPRPASLDGLRPLLEGFEGIPRIDLPPQLEGVLRPYQRQGVDWLVFLRRAGLGALLADDMGLGKTLQALCAIEGRTLVVAPTSVLHGWIREIERFRPELSAALYHGPGRSLDPSVDLTITSYALLRQDVEMLSQESWTASSSTRRR